MKKIVASVVCLTLVVGLWGCGQENSNRGQGAKRIYADMRNVEERDYAMIMIVKRCDADYEFTLGIAKERRVGEKRDSEELYSMVGKSLDELANAYAEEKGKDLSLAHLKMIFFVVGDMEYKEDGELIYMLQQDVEVSKTVPLLLLRDEKDLIKYIENAEEPVGIYLENLTTVKNREGYNVSSLADYLKAWRENLSVKSYYLEKQKAQLNKAVNITFR